MTTIERMELQHLKIGFLGGGHMGRALADALLKAGVPSSQIVIAEPQAQTRMQLQESLGIATVSRGEDLPNDLHVLLLAVKPQDLLPALTPLLSKLNQSTLIISIAAGVTSEQLRALCGGGARVMRAMPNRPASLGVGATALFAGEGARREDRQVAEALLKTAGTVEWISDESLMDVVTALSGSGPAYFFLLAEAMRDAAIAQGLPPEVARRLAAATLAGAGAMCGQTNDLATLRQSVTSKGGTTAAALAQFEQANLKKLVAEAMQAAILRGQALSQQTSGDA
ncbi:MAG: pyrroline-5-carboxylate reductase [Gammaproteobacteria bacterium]|jgi:pyrroline-5-carboxylate reductase|nr:pyrroline-5-carboxylate reductase [Gammaproteobacteria bacterium]